MDSSGERATISEAVGVLHDRRSLQAAVDDLLSSGFDRSELSPLAGEQAVEAKLGHAYRKVAELEDDPAVPRIAYVGNHSLAEARTGIIGGLAYIGAMAAVGAVVASGGTFAAAVAAAALAGGSGGLLGTLVTRILGRERAAAMQQQLDRGGLLLWVRVRDEAHQQRAIEILERHGAKDVHLHQIAASEEPADNPLSGLELDPFLPGARI